jgi:hypothetical protein
VGAVRSTAGRVRPCDSSNQGVGFAVLEPLSIDCGRRDDSVAVPLARPERLEARSSHDVLKANDVPVVALRAAATSLRDTGLGQEWLQGAPCACSQF